MSARPWIVPVGGFLGAGKTTLIVAAAGVLAKRGLKCAAIMNDQGANLVDSAYVSAHGIASNEVVGGCFCCRFSDLLAMAEQLRRADPDVIFIEPVGSCTDLAATILQPLRREFGNQYRLAPLTVLVNPEQPANDPNIAFLFQNQLAEADLVISREDVNALTGVGVEAWIDEVLSGTVTPGEKLLTIDYQAYAEAEAALGWLNWSADVSVDSAVSPAELIGPWIDALQASGLPIVHLKVFDQAESGYLKAALTTRHGEPAVEGDLSASPAVQHAIRLNIRALLGPAELGRLFRQSLAHLAGRKENERFQCFSPSPPKPEKRYAAR